MGENGKTIEPTPGSSPAALIGATVSHYRILERLGGGGMGVVYKAWDLRLERHAALKFLSPQRSSSDDYKRRFSREARTASRLEHPSICTVFESDETDDGRLFIAMAFCEGESLKRKIDRGPLPLPQALAIGAQVAGGLAAAHEKGIVHRDIKPGNIMVAEDGRVKIVDFGIARLTDQTRLTRTGDVMGTTPYVAPEQFLSEDADHRVDLWALGVVLYEMVTGQLPWSGGDDRELANAIVKRPPRPISTLRLDVPQALERVVARALAKRPWDRYQRAEELRADLLAVAEMVSLPATAGPYERTVIEAPSPPSGRAPGDDSPRSRPDTAASKPSAAAAPPAGDAAANRDVPDSAVNREAPEETERRPTGTMTGRVIAHYRILSPLGGGGMGVVYKAQDLALERLVALKFLPPELTRDPDSKTRFLQEARAASALDHPNICTIHEVGETDEGQLYLAMACYEGETLKQRLQRGRLPIDEAVETGQQVARGLVKAHRHGIVHRDIKPANLMITTDDIVKILDFGIAKLVGAAGLTRAGSSLGTPGYMSPEQARGEEVDTRTDVWSLGAVLYEMVTGRRPFRGEHEQTVLYSLFNEEPEPILQLRPDAPPELVRIIGRMLAKDPNQRYPTAGAALSDLRVLYGPVTGTLTGTTSVPLLPPPEPPPKRRAGPLLAAAAILAACLGAYLLVRPGRQAPPSRQVEFKQLTFLPGKETNPSLSREGDFFVYAKSIAGRSHIYWRRVLGENPNDCSKDSIADDSQPALSPDGQRIAFRSERDGGGIFVMGSTCESVLRLTEFGYNPSWSPDGAEILFATEGVSDPTVRRGESQIWRYRFATSEKHPISKIDGVQPTWSPNGLRIAFWGLKAGTQRTIWTIPEAGGPAVEVVSGHDLNWNPVWSPDGKYLYFASNRGGSMNFWKVAIDESSGRTLGEPEPVTTPAPSSAFLSFSRDGRHFVYATDESKSNLVRLDFDPVSGAVNGAPTAVTEGSRNVQTAAASPDGKWIVYNTASPKENLFVIHPDGSGERKLTDNVFKNRVPRWSPDSSTIVFYSDRNGPMQAWTIRPDGSDLRLVSPASPVYEPVWSPDRKTLACTAGAKQAFCLIDLTQPPAARRPIPVPTRGQAFSPFSWSSDGQRLVGLRDSVPGIFMFSFADRSLARITADEARTPVWLHDDRNVLYLVDGTIMMAGVASRVSRQVLSPPAGSEFVDLYPSPNDRFLYTVRSTKEGDIWLATLQ